MGDWVISGEALWQWRQTARQQAIAAEIAPDEVDWLLHDMAGLDRLALRLESFRQREQIALARSPQDLDQLWQQRIEQRVPVQYLTGVAPWRQFTLRVTPDVLIPRPETELLIDWAIALAGKTPLAQGHWADLGTGSGAIALGLADAFPKAHIHAVDRSPAALAIARLNAEQTGLTRHIQFYQGEWFAPLDHLRGRLSGLVSNPPYIPTDLIMGLQPEVAQHEPHLALDGGTDGLDSVRQLIAAAPDYLHPDGLWMVELMAGQAPAVATLLQQDGRYHEIQLQADLAGIERFAIARRV